ncbi:MAG: putative toxin-antitoxin system toxin component, PIN family [Desulfovermiculus sp.]|nr:putative toxin-antitoxin system toxin component, PIN family [Desulfovermiculus sp.]
MRVVLDANVIIAAAAARGVCEAIFELCLEQHELIICESLLREIDEKLRLKIKVPAPVVAEYLQLLRSNAEILTPSAVDPKSCRDPDDLAILGLVSPGNVETIATGDQDLLVLGSYKGAPIITPREFWEQERRSR